MTAGTMAKRAWGFFTRMLFHGRVPCLLKRITQDSAKRIGPKIMLEIFSDMEKKSPRINKIRSVRFGNSTHRYSARIQNRVTATEMIWVFGYIAWTTSRGMDMTKMAVVNEVVCHEYRLARA